MNEENIQYLKEHLSIEIVITSEKDNSYKGYKEVLKVQLYFGNEEFSTSYVNLSSLKFELESA